MKGTVFVLVIFGVLHFSPRPCTAGGSTNDLRAFSWHSSHSATHDEEESQKTSSHPNDQKTSVPLSQHDQSEGVTVARQKVKDTEHAGPVLSPVKDIPREEQALDLHLKNDDNETPPIRSKPKKTMAVVNEADDRSKPKKTMAFWNEAHGRSKPKKTMAFWNEADGRSKPKKTMAFWNEADGRSKPKKMMAVWDQTEGRWKGKTQDESGTVSRRPLKGSNKEVPGNGSTKEALERGSNKEALERDSNKEAFERGSNKEVPGNGSTKEALERGSNKEAPGNGSTKEALERDSNKEVPGNGFTKEALERGSNKEAPGNGSTKEALKRDSNKEALERGSNKEVPAKGSIKEAPEKDSIKETPGKGSIKETPGKGSIKETPGKGSIKETPGKGSIKETPGKGSIKETPGKGSIKEAPGKGSIKETPGKGSIKETPGKGSIKETPGKGSIKETPGKGSIKETPGKGSIQETPGKGSIQETPGKGSIKETPGKGSIKETKEDHIHKDHKEKQAVLTNLKKVLSETHTAPLLPQKRQNEGDIVQHARKGQNEHKAESASPTKDRFENDLVSQHTQKDETVPGYTPDPWRHDATWKGTTSSPLQQDNEGLDAVALSLKKNQSKLEPVPHFGKTYGYENGTASPPFGKEPSAMAAKKVTNEADTNKNPRERRANESSSAAQPPREKERTVVLEEGGNTMEAEAMSVDSKATPHKRAVYSVVHRGERAANNDSSCLCTTCDIDSREDGNFVNVLYNKPAEASSQTSNQGPCLMVDGVNTASDSNLCLYTTASDTRPWFQVDMGGLYSISNFTLTRKADYLPRYNMWGLQALVDGDICYTWSDYRAWDRWEAKHSSAVYPTTCNHVVTGRYFRLQKRDIQAYLSNYRIYLCEIEAMVCKPNYFGGTSCTQCPRICKYVCNHLYGCDTLVPWNVAIKKTATQSSVLWGD
ncbi:enolase-phosphatase E1-like, partial [Littorina saxatilis]|uniref:enolase-phosphatase E1-like n=1 Tax=Littorina saxatilis TaxID=31220 RepID=UPI0038B473A4